MAASYCTFCDPATGQTLRSDPSVGDTGIICGSCSAILGGIPSGSPTNCICADLSTIINGDTNFIDLVSAIPPADNGIYNLIGNGSNNCAAGHYASILNGDTNNIFADYGAIVTGLNNRLAGAHSFMGGGNANTLLADAAVISGGDTNLISGSSHCSFIGGGLQNSIAKASANPSPSIFGVIAGGSQNCIDSGIMPAAPSSYGVIGGGQANTICEATDYGAIFSGCQNTVASNFSAIVGGGTNNIFAASNCSFIGGGSFNSITGIGSVIAGGGWCDPAPVLHGNSIFSNFSFIGSGDTNAINILSDNSFITGGQNNNVGAAGGAGCGAPYSSIGGGFNNSIDDSAAIRLSSGIFGGNNHQIFGSYSFVGGGDTNTLKSSYSVIAGGTANGVTGDCGVIVGGNSNGVYSLASFLGGGDTNSIQAGTACSFIGGGNLNNVGAVAGGFGAVFGVIGGGFNNNIDDSINALTSSGIFGGSNHIVASNNSFIVGGDSNIINVLSDHSFISSGKGNNIGAPGGVGNGATLSGIGGGCNNFIDDTANSMSYSGIFGGINQCIAAASNSFIGGGGDNIINIISNYSFISSGNRNHLGTISGMGLGVLNSGIGGGFSNCMDDTDFALSNSGIFGGSNNRMVANGGFIGGGDTNKICSTVAAINNAAIAGGANNLVSDLAGGTPAHHAFIGGGSGNCALEAMSVVAGGANNNASALHGAIVAGNANTVCGLNGFIGAGGNNTIFMNGGGGAIVAGANNCIGTTGGSVSVGRHFIGAGELNLIDDGSTCSFIGGGFSNYIIGNGSFIGGGGWLDAGPPPVYHGNSICGDFSFIGGGSDNFIDNTGAATSYAVIGGGQNNCVFPGTNHSSIFSGNGNCVADSCSSILGGANNTIPAGFPNAHIVGSGIVLNAGTVGNPNSLHVNGLWANGIPAYPTGYPYPVGTVFSAPIGVTPLTGSILYIM